MYKKHQVEPVVSEIRFAKIFTGTKKNPDYRTELQYFHKTLKEWLSVETEWASPDDETKYTKAQKYQELNQYR